MKKPIKMKKASMAKKKGEKMPMKIDPKTGKKVPAFLKMKKGSMAKITDAQKRKLNPGLVAAIKKEEKSGMMMKKAAMKLKKESAMKLKKSMAMLKKSMATMKKASAMKMKMKKSAAKLMKKK